MSLDKLSFDLVTGIAVLICVEMFVAYVVIDCHKELKREIQELKKQMKLPEQQ